MARPITTRNHQFMDSLVIGGGHTIMANHLPDRVSAQDFVEKFYEWVKPTPETVASFGLFGGDIDYNTYYPDLKPEDLVPKDEEFIEPIFRLLSATVVSKGWNPTDFSQGGILKASMPMLLGQTVNCDHETNIGNAIGSVSKVIWQDSYKYGNFTIPAGINGVLRIDGKSNPRIARGILMEPPSIHSNSVTVQFRWDKSHPNMSDQEFFDKIGTYDEKGNMVRRMVTEIVRYLETSLVSHGADSFAQKVDEDGRIVNPEFAKKTWSSYSEYIESGKKVYTFSDFKDSDKVDDTTSSLIEPSIQTTHKSGIMTLEEFIASLFGEGMLVLGENQEQNEETVVNLLKEVVSSRDSFKEQVNNLTTEKNTLQEQVNNLNAQVANLTEMSTVGKNYIASLRESVVADYKKLRGDDADEAIITMINSETTGLKTVLSLQEEYKAQLEEKFPLTCSKCGSHDVSRASSQGSSTQKTEETQNVENTQDCLEKLYRSKL